eukprot:TRINITY_DN36708_c0_g1_i1.p1 TRINITY_DN36708_c0_g1~~TRINITY_DN36708_c0_g1_i1.p1  ORF type:complete len:596 (-),score=73.34 TRINITY_DN36708_c0_g1_i1:129-1763(-)
MQELPLEEHGLGSIASQLAGLVEASSAPATGNAQVATTISDIIEQMKVKLRAAHNESLATLAQATADLEACVSTYQAADPVRFASSLLGIDSHLLKLTHEAAPAACASHPQCNQLGLAGDCCPAPGGLMLSCCEPTTTQPPMECQGDPQTQATLQAECENNCSAQAAIITQSCTNANPDCAPLECAATSGEEYRAYLQRMVDYIDGIVPDTTNLTSPCIDIVEWMRNCTQHCSNTTAPPTVTCCATRASQDHEICTRLNSQRTAWANYSSCYDNALVGYNTVTQEVEFEASSRRAQMRSIKRIECLLNTFNTSDQAARIATCISTDQQQTADVLSMIIVIPNPAAKLQEFACNASSVPGSAEYDAQHYGHLSSAVSVCPISGCDSVCAPSTTGTQNLTAPGASTGSTTVAPVTNSASSASPGDACYELAAGSTAAYWDMGSLQTLGDVEVSPGASFTSIRVYLSTTGAGSLLDENSFCGTISASTAPHKVSCGGISVPGRFLVLKPAASNGAPSWCGMKVDGDKMCIPPVATTGVQTAPCTSTR